MFLFFYQFRLTILTEFDPLPYDRFQTFTVAEFTQAFKTFHLLLEENRALESATGVLFFGHCTTRERVQLVLR